MRFIKSASIFLLFLFLIQSCNPTLEPDTSGNFIKFLGTAYNQKAYAMDSTADGGFVIVGSRDSLGLKRTIFAAKIDQFGNRVWESVFSSPDATSQEGRDLIVLENGNILILGFQALNTTTDPLDCRLLLLELDADGKQISQGLFGSEPMRTDGDFYLVESKNNFLLLANTFEFNEDDNSNMYLVKLSNTKNLIFERPYGLIDRDDPTGSIIDLDGDLVWCGTSKRDAGASDLRIIRASEFGNLKFDFNFIENDGESQSGVEVQRIGNTKDLVAIGTDSSTANNSDIFLIRTDEFGQAATGWENGIKTDLGANEVGMSVAPTSDGGFILTGSSATEKGKEQIFLIKLAADGSEEWQQFFGQENGSKGQIVRQTQDGGYIVLATVKFGVNTVLGLIKTNAQGVVE